MMSRIRIVLTLVFCTIALNGFGQKVTIDGITYRIEDGEASVFYADKKIENAVILSTVKYKNKTYPVTKIGDGIYVGLSLTIKTGFWGCKKLKSVIIPNSIKEIQGGTFYGCKMLQEVSIPNSVTFIGANVFFGTALKRIVVPDSPIVIYKDTNGKSSAFTDCKYISEVICQDGSFPEYILSYLPEHCPFMLANNKNNYQKGTNELPSFGQTAQPKQQQASEPSSDVDLEIPQTTANNKNTFAIVIANEDYQREAKVDFANNDGVTFKKYCHQVLGLPEKNVHLVENGTLNNMIYELDWLGQVCKAYNGEASVIFYYAGHGVPDEADGKAYLLPIDGTGKNLRTCLSTEELYKTLGGLPAKSVTVLMDACFSGTKRSGEMLASARGVAIQAKASAPKGNMVVLSAAQGDETAYSYKDTQHGLFTYFLLKKLKESKGAATLGELAEYVETQVKRFSIVENGKSQTPSVSYSSKMEGNWRSITLK